LASFSTQPTDVPSLRESRLELVDGAGDRTYR